MDEQALAAALRRVITALADVVAVLEGDVPGQQHRDRRIAVLRAFDVPPGAGLSRAEASHALAASSYDPRSFGGWVHRGLIERDGDRRYLTAKGRELLAALTEQAAASPPPQ